MNYLMRMDIVPNLSIQEKLVLKLEKGIDEITDIIKTSYEDDKKVIKDISNIYKKIRKSSINKELVEQGLTFMAKHHLGQYRDSGEPSMAHGACVGYILSLWNQPTSIVLAGNLHDIVEDNETTSVDMLNKIEKFFGLNVLLLINDLTSFEKDIEKKDRVLYDKIKNYKGLYSVKKLELIKIADNIHNLYTLNGMLSKYGLDANKRKERFINTVKKEMLPIAKEIDKTKEIKLKLVPYLEDLML